MGAPHHGGGAVVHGAGPIPGAVALPGSTVTVAAGGQDPDTWPCPGITVSEPWVAKSGAAAAGARPAGGAAEAAGAAPGAGDGVRTAAIGITDTEEA